MVNWGIIGCGNVTEVKSGPAFNKAGDSKLVAVMRRNAALAGDYARRHNVQKFYTNASELINDKEVTAVYVATPPGSHKEYAIQAIRAGKPVYIEKPMALNFKECNEINNEAEKHNVPVFVAYYRRALPGFVLVKEMIEQHQIGKVRFVQLQLFKNATPDEIAGNLPWRVDPALSGGGHFFDLACHQLDWLDFVFGPVKEVRSVVKNHSGLYKAEDFVSAEFVFGEDIIATGTWSFSVSPECGRDTIEIFGSSGSIKFSTFSFDPIILTNASGIKVFDNERPGNVQIYLIEKIVKALHGKGESPSTGTSAARTNRVMDEVVKEYYGR
ncbi:MAG TPA: Gfo/Idh/MocA family oxidoreductase [Bacteroidales bacterium]|nr:Gfo/Idh/MocA family oxidoreductase [Bacteroidales bacterium]